MGLFPKQAHYESLIKYSGVPCLYEPGGAYCFETDLKKVYAHDGWSDKYLLTLEHSGFTVSL